MTYDEDTHLSCCFVSRAAGGEIDSRWCTAHYVEALSAISADIAPADINCDELRLYRDEQISIYLTPFDNYNTEARVVLVGITPGRHQMHLAVKAAGEAFRRGCSVDQAIAEAKQRAAFEGRMRNILIRMLDDIGVHQVFGLSSCLSLFEDRSDLVSCTSAICHAVFVKDRENYRGRPEIDRHPVLRAFAKRVLAYNISSIPNALVVPFGPVVSQAVLLAGVDPSRVLHGFPHPSPANQGRNGATSNVFLAGKSRWSEIVARKFQSG